MPFADAAALHPLQQRERGIATATRIAFKIVLIKIARRDLPRRQMQRAFLRTPRAERRRFEPRSGRQEVIDLAAACRTFPARDFDGRFQCDAIGAIFRFRTSKACGTQLAIATRR